MARNEVWSEKEGTNLPQRLKVGADEPPPRPVVHWRADRARPWVVALLREALGVRPEHGGAATDFSLTPSGRISRTHLEQCTARVEAIEGLVCGNLGEIMAATALRNRLIGAI
jgi:hypothetical protein